MALDISDAADVPMMLRLIRHLYEGEGDDFALLLAQYIRENQILISEKALEKLITSIKYVRM